MVPECIKGQAIIVLVIPELPIPPNIRIPGAREFDEQLDSLKHGRVLSFELIPP
jgi:hypothetical protein